MHTITLLLGPLSAVLLTYAVHSALLLGAAWLVHGLLGNSRNASREGAWRFALLSAVLSTGIQLGFAVEPLAGRLELSGVGTPPAGTPTPLPHGECDAEPAQHDQVGTPAPKESWARQGAAAAPSLPAAAAPRRWTAVGLLCVAWLVLAPFLLLRLISAHFHLRRLLRDRRPVEGRLRRRLDELVASAGVRSPVDLSVSSRLPVPLALGIKRPEICLPSAALDALDVAEQDAVLAHELAHVARRDPLWLAVAHLLENLCFFQPLQRIARRRLQDLAELRADDWASQALGDSLGLARCLTTVAGWQLAGRPAAAATPLAERPSQLRRRIERLLVKGEPMPSRPASPWILVGGLALVACATVAAPSVSTKPTPPPSPPVEEVAPTPPAPHPSPAPPTAPEPAPSSTPAPAPRPSPPSPPAQPAPPVSPLGAPPAPPAPALAPPAPPDTSEHLSKEKAHHPFDSELIGELAALEASMADMEATLEESLAPLQGELEAQLQALDQQLESDLEPVLREVERRLEDAATSQQSAALAEEQARRVQQILAELSSALQEQIEASLGPRLHEELAEAIQATIRGPDPQALQDIARRLEHAHRTAELGEVERAALQEELRRLAEESRPTREEMDALRQRLETLRPSEDELRALQAATAEAARAASERLREELESQPEVAPPPP